MKTRHRQAAILMAVLGTATVSMAAVGANPGLLPESRVWVDGTSTVRDYSCKATTMTGSIDAAAATLEVAKLQGAVRAAELAIPVTALECGNSTMNSHLRKALKATEHPAIRFRLSGYEVAAGEGETKVKMNATLQIAGQEQPIVIDGMAMPVADGAVRIKGSKDLVMSEFGVKPPSLMMGTMKVRDKVTVNFDVVVKP